MKQAVKWLGAARGPHRRWVHPGLGEHPHTEVGGALESIALGMNKRKQASVPLCLGQTFFSINRNAILVSFKEGMIFLRGKEEVAKESCQ